MARCSSRGHGVGQLREEHEREGAVDDGFEGSHGAIVSAPDRGSRALLLPGPRSGEDARALDLLVIQRLVVAAGLAALGAGCGAAAVPASEPPAVRFVAFPTDA